MRSAEEIKKAIADFFGDTSRSHAETREGLEEIASTAESYLDALQDDKE